MPVVRALLFVMLAAFMLHGVWECAHIGLYDSYEKISGPLPVTLWATIGDVLYTLFAIALVSLFKDNSAWICNPTVRNYVGLSILGFCIALFVEYKAFVFAKWAYTAAMPVVPFLGVGLSPLLQMTLLLPLSVFVATLLCHRPQDTCSSLGES